MENRFKRFLSLAMAIMMVISLMPTTAFAEELEHEHSYDAVVTAPSCTAAGFTTYSCACGDSYTADEVAALEHVYDNFKCACGAIDPAHEHSYEAAVTAPSCTAAGFTAYSCVCGDSYTADEVGMLDHVYAEGYCACGAADPNYAEAGDDVIIDTETEAAAETVVEELITNDSELAALEDDGLVNTEADLIAAVAEGGVVELAGDIELSNTLVVSGNVTLNLNGYTLSQSTDRSGHYEMIKNNGSLTVTGNGKISLTYTGAGDAAFGWGTYTIGNYGALVVENGTVEMLCGLNNDRANHMYSAIQQGGGASSSTTILGGVISNPSYRSVRINQGSLNISGGNFEGQIWMQPFAEGTSIAISGGSFAPRGIDGSSVYVENSAKSVAMSVTGGYFATKIGAANAAGLAGCITGGTFSEAAQSGINPLLLGEGYNFTENGELVYKLDTEADLIAAIAKGGTVKLDDNIELSDTLVVSGNVTLDLNGYTISQSTDRSGHYEMIKNNGSLTVTGNGKISLTYTGAGDAAFGWGTYTIGNYGALVVENGTVEILCGLNEGSANHMYCAIHQGGGASSITTILGGVISNPNYRSVRINQGSLNISGGNFEGQVWMHPFANGTSLAISGGSFAPRGVDGSSVYVENSSKTVAMSVTGGYFATKIGAANAAALAGCITGGTFSAAAQSGTNPLLLAKGYAFDENGEFINVIDTEADLIAAIAEGGVVELAGDIELSDTLVVSGNVTLNLNGYTISQSTDRSGHYEMIKNNGNLTVTGNGKISLAYTGAGDAAFGWGTYTIGNYGALVVENGTVEILCNLNDGRANHMYSAIQQGGGASSSTTILGGVISNPNYRSVRINQGSLNISGGNFEGQIWMQPFAEGTSIAISGGSFAPRGIDGSSVYVENSAKSVAMSVTGGYFETKIGAANAAGLAGCITGGTFSAAAQSGTNKLLMGEGCWFNKAGQVVNEGVIDSESALVAAIAKGGTVTLADNIELSNTLVVSGNVTLNLNGYTISQSTDRSGHYEMIKNNGSLTVTGNGKISLAYTGAGDAAFGWGTYTIGNYGALTVENGTIEMLCDLNTEASKVHMYCAIQQGGGASSNTTILGGTISTPHYRSVRINQGSLNISGGNFEGQIWMQPFAEGTSIAISGGSFAPRNGDGSSVYVENSSKTVAMSVTGGYFATKIGVANAAALAGSITGGTFSEAAQSGTNKLLVAEGYWYNDAGQVVETEASVMLNQNYLALRLGESYELKATVKPGHIEKPVLWSIEGKDEIVSVDANTGVVTANKVGTDYVLATLEYDGESIIVRCRVDVTPADVEIAEVQLSNTKLSTELFKTDYTSFDILIYLEQNLPVNAMAAASNEPGNGEENENLGGVRVKSACFTDLDTASRFDIQIQDDRTALIVPTSYAYDNPSKVASKYVSDMKIVVDDKEFFVEDVTLSVKKTKPSLKVTVDAFNSFYSEDTTRTINVVGGSNPVIKLNDAYKNSLPEWLELVDGKLVLQNAPLKSVSGTAKLKVYTDEWSIPVAVSVPVKNNYKAPALKLPATTVNVANVAEFAAGVPMKLQCKVKGETLADLNVKGISASEGYVVVPGSFNYADGSFILNATDGFKAEPVTLTVSFTGTAVTLDYVLNIRLQNVTLKSAVKAVTLNKTVGETAVIDVIASPSNYQLGELSCTVFDSQNKETTDALEIISANKGKVEVTTKESCAAGKYTLQIGAAGSSVAKVTVTVVEQEPSVSYKLSGSMDLSFPENGATVSPVFKNYGGVGFKLVSYSLTEMKGSAVVGDASNAFTVERKGNAFVINCVDQTVNYKNKFVLNMKLELENGKIVENNINVKLKNTAVQLKLDTSGIVLNKLIGDMGVVNVSCSNKNYDLDSLVTKVVDSDGNAADEELTLDYESGKLYIELNDKTRYDEVYKISLKAHAAAAEKVLTVTVPAEAESAITASISVKGKLDVIRDGSAITVTPTYKNCSTAVPANAQLQFYSSEDGYENAVTDLFEVSDDGNGGFIVTRKDGAQIDRGNKYKVMLVADLGVKTNMMPMSITMGSAKLKAQITETQLFAKDKHDRAEISFTSSDANLNKVSKLEIVDKGKVKYSEMFEVIEHEDGTFSIGFANGELDESLITKKPSTTVSFSVKVFVDGNASEKNNATITVKLTIVK